jgi:hypothetical protein
MTTSCCARCLRRDCSTRARRAVGRYPAGYLYTVEADTRRAEFAAWLIGAKQPHLHTSYFSVLDEVEHAHGPFAKEVFATLEAIDGMVDRVAKAAISANPRSIVCVVSDHGFARYDKTVSVNVALQKAGLIDLDAAGRVTDWRAIMWSNALMIKEPANAETKRTVRTVLDALVADSSSGVFRYFDDAEARKEEGFPDAAFVVGVRPGFAISGRVTGALVEDHAPAARTDCYANCTRWILRSSCRAPASRIDRSDASTCATSRQRWRVSPESPCPMRKDEIC